MPVVRVDAEVWSWLKSQAQPFEDTPNSVLRRIAGLDGNQRGAPNSTNRGPTMPSTLRRTNARMLNQEWQVGAAHALYHRDGTWYNNLTRFPGALFDPHGYVIFKTEKDYLRSPHLRVTQETNVPQGIKSIPGYVRMKS